MSGNSGRYKRVLSVESTAPPPQPRSMTPGHYSGRSMLHGIATILSGSVVAQVIAVAALPVLTRLYDAEAFGRFQIYAVFLNVLTILVAFRYEVAMLNAREGREFENLVRLTLRLILATTFVFMLVVLLFSDTLVEYRVELAGVVYLLVPAMLVAGLHQLLIYQPIRNRDYQLSALSKVIQSAGFVASGIACAIPALAAIGLVLADIAGRIAGGFWILKRTPGLRAALRTKHSPGELLETARAFRRFPLLTFPGTLISSLGAAAVPLVFLALFDLSVAGQFALVDRFILLPVGVVATAIAQVYTGDSASQLRNNPGSLNRTYRRTLVFLSAIGIAPAVIGFLVAPTLIPIVFGPHWTLAGELCAVGFAIAFIRFLAVPFNMVLVICDRQLLQLTWEIARMILIVGAFGAVYYLGIREPVLVMKWYAGTVILTYFFYLVLADRVTRRIQVTSATTDGKQSSPL